MHYNIFLSVAVAISSLLKKEPPLTNPKSAPALLRHYYVLFICFKSNPDFFKNLLYVW